MTKDGQTCGGSACVVGCIDASCMQTRTSAAVIKRCHYHLHHCDSNSITVFFSVSRFRFVHSISVDSFIHSLITVPGTYMYGCLYRRLVGWSVGRFSISFSLQMLEQTRFVVGGRVMSKEMNQSVGCWPKGTTNLCASSSRICPLSFSLIRLIHILLISYSIPSAFGSFVQNQPTTTPTATATTTTLCTEL